MQSRYSEGQRVEGEEEEGVLKHQNCKKKVV